MSGGDPTDVVGKLVRACFSILLAAVALSWAVGLIQSILPTLLFTAGLVGAVWLGIVVFRTWRERW